jgi:hypothetical protein
MFCSNSVWRHLGRGAAALVLMAAAFELHAIIAGWAGTLLSLLAVLGAFVLMRGCPMCWLMGLFQTLQEGRAGKR